MKTLTLTFGNTEYELLTLLAKRSPQCNLTHLINHLLSKEFNDAINYDQVLKKAWETEKENQLKIIRRLNNG